MKRAGGIILMIVGWVEMIAVSFFMREGTAKTEAKIFGLTLIVFGLQLATL